MDLYGSTFGSPPGGSTVTTGGGGGMSPMLNGTALLGFGNLLRRMYPQVSGYLNAGAVPPSEAAVNGAQWANGANPFMGGYASGMGGAEGLATSQSALGDQALLGTMGPTTATEFSGGAAGAGGGFAGGDLGLGLGGAAGTDAAISAGMGGAGTMAALGAGAGGLGAMEGAELLALFGLMAA